MPMTWDPQSKPRLRPVEHFEVPSEDGASYALHDPSQLSPASLQMSPAALLVLSMMDGAHTCDAIRETFAAQTGSQLPADKLYSMIEQLDQCYLLEGPTFEAHYDKLVADYRAAPVRTMPHAADMGIVSESDEPFTEMLADVDGGATSGTVVGLIAPHLDYPRGGPMYGAAYATLRNRPAPDRVVILGANHFGRSLAVVATDKPFATPLGTTPTDVAFLERLEARCGGLRRYELDHMREHSIELQVALLQHLFGATAFEIVPVLCPDPCGPTGTAPYDGVGVDLADFAAALGELVAADDADTLMVAGADLSHIGAAFGDDRPLDAAFLEEVRRQDMHALEAVAANDPIDFVRRVGDNPTRVCSAGCVFALLSALPGASATRLGYHQAVDQSSQTGVTSAAVALNRPT